jgi:hypothetical protein
VQYGCLMACRGIDWSGLQRMHATCKACCSWTGHRDFLFSWLGDGRADGDLLDVLGNNLINLYFIFIYFYDILFFPDPFPLLFRDSSPGLLQQRFRSRHHSCVPLRAKVRDAVDGWQRTDPRGRGGFTDCWLEAARPRTDLHRRVKAIRGGGAAAW